MEFKDYYKIMGLTEDASAQDIKKAYKRLARKYHPDVSKEADAELKFKELGEAYEVLKDKDKKAEYDQLKKAGSFNANGGFRPPPGWESASRQGGNAYSGADAEQFSDFFRDIFGEAGFAGSGAGRGQSYKRRGEDVHYKLPLFLEEVFAGCEKQIKFTISEMDEQGHIVQKNKTLKLKVPKGLGQGQQLRLKGQGGSGLGGAANGDLFVEVELAPHPIFQVTGKDIYLHLPVAPWEAALGAVIEIPTVNSRGNVTIPKGSVTGSKLKLKGKGMPGEKPGDLIIILEIDIPVKHSAEAEELYSKLAAIETEFQPRAKLNKP